jgi:integrase
MLETDELRMVLGALDGKQVTLKEPDEETGKPVKVKLPARPVLRAMVLLACNGGLGNTDLSEMTFDHVDLDSGWVDYPRVKTGVERRFPLWPETLEAVKLAIAERPEPKDPANKNLIFLTN